VNYTNYTNLDSHYSRTYEPGDRLVRGWTGIIDRRDVSFANGLLEIAEEVFARHNHDDRPDGQLCPSMSVGDVVIIGEVALSVASTGWKQVDVQLDDLITDIAWKDIVA
jgi:hypothetical protein